MNFLEYFAKRDDVKKILADDIRLGGTCSGYNELLIASDFISGTKTIFVVLPTLYDAQKYYDSLTQYVNEDDVLFFPADELVSAEMISSTGDFLYERIETLYTLLTQGKKIVITNLHGAIRYEMSVDKWVDNIFVIDNTSSFDINDLAKKLTRMGYEPVFTISKTGEFSKRGSIIDIFPLGYTNPVRIDFFGDDVESIKEFSLETQRSVCSIDNISILPVTELIYDQADIDSFKLKLAKKIEGYDLSKIEEEMYDRDIMNLTLHKSLDTITSRYLALFDYNKSTIFDFSKEKKIYLIDPGKAFETYQRISMDLADSCGRMGGYSLMAFEMFNDYKSLEAKCNVLIEGLRDMGGFDIDLHAKEILPYNANRKAIMQDIKDYHRKKRLILSITDPVRIKNMQSLLEENGMYLSKITDYSKINAGGVYLETIGLPSFNLEYDDLMILNEETIFEVEKKKKAKYKSIYKSAQKISHYDELEVGDYVVHYDYGIGIYKGIETLELSGVKRDVLSVEYGGNSGIYIPLEHFSEIMKYASKDVEGILINTIGDASWARAKARVRKRVHDISAKLIALYSERSKTNGFKYPADSIEQSSFESDFNYELTPDQEKAVNDIKHDMESEKPMDRLICGDVGYGKTEVALRAAFKAVCAGKQVAVLAPTTILARQHFLTFKSRMEEYGARVDLLSRFVTKKQQTNTIAGIKSGVVDVVVGTHRLLSNEIEYHDLGLLIVDEEQRFGVTHKEKIKELKVNVDCITLSATPIPRTLQMSMMGIKDLSMIETPPKNRYPIQTYVLERNDRVIQDAILREISRGGQVFYLYNWVDTIEDEAARIRNLVPEAKICVGHGKMTKDKLEDTIQSFIDKEYDVLICTTIIETGIDMPDTNTLIIHDSDRLGLSQMYQIRGRVGRSNKIAYAYLMYEPRKILTQQAEKRLQTIKEFNELGSGFKIAMRDLSIRGSGDLLGEEQSGFVESVGIDMYLKILDEEINHKDEEPKKKVVAQPLVDRTISTDYINNDDTRIQIHKKIDAIRSIADMEKLNEELLDRFGAIPNDMRLYMYEKLMRNMAEDYGIERIDNSLSNELKFIMSRNASTTVDALFLFNTKVKFSNIKLTSDDGKIIMILNNKPKDKAIIFLEMINYLTKLIEHETSRNV